MAGLPRNPVLVVLIWALACSPAFSHDTWLIADKSTANDGDVVWLSFVTGEVFPFGEKATDAARVAHFVDRLDDKSVDIIGYRPEDKGLSVRRPIAGAGLHVIGCALSQHLIEMKPGDFEKYLRSERAEAALAANVGILSEPPGRPWLSCADATAGKIDTMNRAARSRRSHRLN